MKANETPETEWKDEIESLIAAGRFADLPDGSCLLRRICSECGELHDSVVLPADLLREFDILRADAESLTLFKNADPHDAFGVLVHGRKIITLEVFGKAEVEATP